MLLKCIILYYRYLYSVIVEESLIFYKYATDIAAGDKNDENSKRKSTHTN